VAVDGRISDSLDLLLRAVPFLPEYPSYIVWKTAKRVKEISHKMYQSSALCRRHCFFSVSLHVDVQERKVGLEHGGETPAGA